MKVLIVDDDIFSRMMLMHLIAACGQFDFVEAEDGLDAWQQLEGGLLPAILFCDVRMPRLSGLDLLQRVKRDARLSSVPFVLISTANELHTAQQAVASGAAGYIGKPFQADRVRIDLRLLLDQARARAPLQ
ncbi:MAG: two-component system chemotaxis response regulator CheY [Janthinobacterium sp.]|jgi:two-component system chemotaxis response regulator CheY